MTRYSVSIFVNDEWEGIALFSDKASISAMITFADSQFDMGNNLTCPADNIRVLDMETGEIIFDWQDEHSSWDDDPDDWGDWGYNEDMGFDPYLGCYTDDC